MGLLYSLNKMLPDQIALAHIFQVPDDFHCRFDAISRSYIYNIHVSKNPFKSGFSFYFPALAKADFELMVRATEIIKNYTGILSFL